MIRVSVFYPYNDGAAFNWEYYLGTHMPLVNRKVGAALKGVSVEQGVSGGQPGSSPAFVAQAHLTFESLQSFQEGFGPHAAEIMGDIPNYTAIEPIVQISEIKL